LPSILAAIVIAFFIPESPKFTYAQGDKTKTLHILRNIFRMNTGKSILEYEVKKLDDDPEVTENSAKNCGFFKFMWSQTAPLFKSPHLRNTATACFLQFGVCVACNGMYTFYAEITNKIHLWLDSSSSAEVSATVCEVLDYFKDQNFTLSIAPNLEEPLKCVTKLEISTFFNLMMLTAIYSGGWLIISFIINFTGKLVILVFFMVACGASSILLIFVTSPEVAIYLYLVLLGSGVNMTVVNASTVELYPTTLRCDVNFQK
jgi:MFS transporter, VNT family, synaptic vesicle glycoprotein 2